VWRQVERSWYSKVAAECAVVEGMLKPMYAVEGPGAVAEYLEWTEARGGARPLASMTDA